MTADIYDLDARRHPVSVACAVVGCDRVEIPYAVVSSAGRLLKVCRACMEELTAIWGYTLEET
ncbi:MAG: hypothetical protein L0Z49_04580 [Actinobacteria bacterium]|nr:hypothetical protein [Actinomycetota bacterium]